MTDAYYPLLGEGANKQVIFQADSLIKISRIQMIFSANTSNQPYLGYFSTISGVISGFTEILPLTYHLVHPETGWPGE